MLTSSKNWDSRKKIMAAVFCDAKLRHKALQRNWYEKNNQLDILEEIYITTSFLDTNASLRERLYYVESDLVAPVICTFCKTRQLRLKLGGSLNFYKSCLSAECQVLCKAQATSTNWHKQSEKQMQSIKEKISISNSGKQRSLEVRQTQSARMRGTKQSKATVSNRMNSRKTNGKPWLSASTKQKLSESNKKTHSSPEFRAKYKTVYANSRVKQSTAMKAKIANGSFTPPITNSWTRWAAYANKNRETKRFRSSWEAAFWLLTDFEYEKVRVPYQYNGKDRVYIVDFVDHAGKTIFEIKPDSTRNTSVNKLKFEAATAWAQSNGYAFEVIGNSWFAQHITDSLFIENDQLRMPLRQFV